MPTRRSTLLGRLSACALPVIVASGLRATPIFVAPDGRPDNTGSVESPLTFQAAIDKARRALRSREALAEAVTIHVRGGRYRFAEPFVLGPEFQGTEDRPIVIAAYAGEEVWFDGKRTIGPEGFGPVTGPGERARLAGSAVDRVVVTTVTDSELARALAGDLGQALAFDGGMYLPSVFPNEGYATLNEHTDVPEVSPPAVPVGKEGYGVRAGHPPYVAPGTADGWLGTLREPRGARVGFEASEGLMAGTWAQWEAEIARDNTRSQLVGFIDANWFYNTHPIVGANAARRTIHLAKACAYGWAWKKTDKPFRVVGLLCELDQPGEWHFDPGTGRLYLYPPRPITPRTSIGLPYAGGFISFDGARHVHVVGINVEGVGGGGTAGVDGTPKAAVYHLGGAHNLVARGTIRNCTAVGVRLVGRDNRVLGMDIVDVTQHVHLRGGVRAPDEITAGRNVVENCHLYQKHFRHERVNVFIDGVGQVFRHNLVHNSLGQSVWIHGNDHLLEFNELFNIGYDEGDGGAMYSGADMAGYGNVYRHNFFHHLMHVPGKVERSGIHLDDHQSGAICIGNVFYKSASKGIFMNGGNGHTLRGNIFLEGRRGIYSAGHGAQTAHDRQVAILRDGPEHKYFKTKENYIGRVEKVVGPEGWNTSPWKDRYPLFHRIMNEDGRFGRMWPIYSDADSNSYYGNTLRNRTEWDERIDREAMEKVTIENDMAIEPDDFVDYDALDLRVKRGRGVEARIPFERIGLYLDRYRAQMPDKDHYRAAVKAFFAGIPSHPGTRKQIDTAEVVDNGPIVTR